MLKKLSIIILSVSALSLVLLIPLTVNFDNIGKDTSNDVVSESQVEANYLAWLKKLVWPVAKSVAGGAGDYFYNVEPSYTSSQYGETITPGSIDFNSDTAGAATYFDFKIPSTGHSVNVYADSVWYSIFTRKISVTLTNPYGYYVINRTVNPTQWSTYSPGITGDYRATWTQNSSQSWTPYLGYRYDNGYAIANDITNDIISLNTVSAKNSDTKDVNEHMITVETYGNIIKPSKEHISHNSKSKNSNTFLNAVELDQQFIDSSLGVHVYGMKDYEVGDNVYFEDTIVDIKYDEEKNHTKFTFNGGEDYMMVFRGDLTNEYKVGEMLNLKFKVKQLIKGDNKLAIIDYFKHGLDYNKKAPNINKYLIK